jgi:hypothetical protein
MHFVHRSSLELADMNRKLSQRLLIAEAVVLALPVTAMLILGITEVSFSANEDAWPRMAIDLITVLAALAAFAGWWLIVQAVRGGADALQATHRGWWLAAAIGVLLVIAAVMSMVLPASPEYTPAATFREHLELCVLGGPLIIVLGHLWAEAWFRKSANKPMHATREDARA